MQIDHQLTEHIRSLTRSSPSSGNPQKLLRLCTFCILLDMGNIWRTEHEYEILLGRFLVYFRRNIAYFWTISDELEFEVIENLIVIHHIFMADIIQRFFKYGF
uniref:Uncharacterized protein n=1 Tax=Romanomermis culicivorax TaxID=13658 RepID=A0A915I3V9_ROMCU